MTIAIHILLAVLLAAYAYMLFTSRLNLSRIRYYAIAILLAGTGLYVYAYSLEPTQENMLTIVIRSLISSIELFVWHPDLLEVEHAQMQPMFLDMFIFVYACAVLTSVSAVISMFGKRTMTDIKLHLSRNIRLDHVFFGTDPNSMMLARSIMASHKDDGCRIAFIEFPDKAATNKVSLGEILRSVLSDKEEKYAIDSKKAMVLRSSASLAEIDEADGVLKGLGLERMAGMITDSTCFYILSDDTDFNVKGAMKLAKDPYFEKRTVNCFASKNNSVSVFELSLFNTGIRFIYPETMAAVSMKKIPDCHPCSLMKKAVDTDGNSLGYVEGTFNSMVVGFSETGQAAAKFLYEYSTACDKDGNVIPYMIYVADPNLEMSLGRFIGDMPAVYGDKHFSFETLTPGSVTFWKRVAELADDLNMVVVCEDDDSAGLDIAYELFRYAYRRRKGGMKDFKILVRLYDINDDIDKAIAFFNSLAGSKIIIPFGGRETIFSHDNLVSDNPFGMSVTAYRRVKEFYSKFARTKGEVIDWKEHERTCREAKDTKKYHDYAEILRAMRQHMSVAYHAFSKKMICDRITDDSVLERMAKWEHARWCAAAKMSGFVYADKSDVITRRSEFLTDWDNLPEEEKERRRTVVSASFPES